MVAFIYRSDHSVKYILKGQTNKQQQNKNRHDRNIKNKFFLKIEMLL